MLKIILQKMATQDVYNHADLARQLEISKDLLSRMLEELARKGYLTALSPSGSERSHCSGGCRSCRACSPVAVNHLRDGF